MSKKRLFIGTKIPNKSKKKISNIKGELNNNFPSVKWVKDSNLHITVAFLGYLEESKIRETKGALNKLEETKPFRLKINNLKIYSKRVVLADLADDDNNFKRLQKSISKKLERAGIRVKTSKPHITLGRITHLIKSEEIYKLRNSISKIHNLKEVITVNKISLFESKLTKKGPVYKQIDAVDLTPKNTL